MAASPDTTSAAKGPEIDVSASIPSGLWIVGRNLEVELGGNLDVVQRGGLPVVTGRLQALQGRFVFLGRTLTMQRGEVVFYGGDEIDPSLDLQLATVVEDATIYITITGTVREPNLKLSSDPEMSEGDIMSSLLFGKAVGELDTGQAGLLENRASQIATTYAAGELQERLSRQLGVDLVSIRTADKEGGKSTVVLGKYLSPRVLLKYEQALNEASTFFVNLEYLLNRRFKVETLIGSNYQSGVELNWSVDY
jgi:translocation and assembly module TamB